MKKIFGTVISDIPQEQNSLWIDLKNDELRFFNGEWKPVYSSLFYRKSETYSKSALDTKFNGKEDKSNKVTSISASSTNTQYPSAKCVYDAIQAGGGGGGGAAQYHELVVNSVSPTEAIEGASALFERFTIDGEPATWATFSELDFSNTVIVLSGNLSPAKLTVSYYSNEYNEITVGAGVMVPNEFGAVIKLYVYMNAVDVYGHIDLYQYNG
jgi:hypothetical protein